MSQLEIPDSWRLVKLEKVATIQTGLAKGKKNLKDPVRRPYLRVANVQDGYLDLSEIKEIEIERNQLERYLLKKGDVLLTEGGDNDKLGRGALWQGELQNCLHQNHIFVVRPHPEILLAYYLSSLTGSPYGKAYFRKASKQSTNLASINTKQLKSFPVLLPPLHEQHKIIGILSTWDEAIVRTEQVIAALQQRKKGLMQRLLTGEVRFPGFDGEWRKTELGEFFYPFSKTNSANEDLTVLSCSTIHGIVPQTVIFGKRIASDDIRRYKVVERGDLIYDPMLLWDASIGFLEVVESGVISPAYSTFKFRKKSGNREYFKYLLKSHYYRQHYKYYSG